MKINNILLLNLKSPSVMEGLNRSVNKVLNGHTEVKVLSIFITSQSTISKTLSTKADENRYIHLWFADSFCVWEISTHQHNGYKSDRGDIISRIMDFVEGTWRKSSTTDKREGWAKNSAFHAFWVARHHLIKVIQRQCKWLNLRRRLTFPS